MYAYGQEMERDQQSITRSSSSEVGSHYSTETGLFMSTFTATVFVSGVVTLGLSLLSLVIALTVMLQSCERKSSGILETQEYLNSYEHYCKNLASHAELNGFGTDYFPAICKDVIARYVRNGGYRRDLNDSVRIAEDFFFTGPKKLRAVVMIDADDLDPESLINLLSTRGIKRESFHDIGREADYLKHRFVLKLYLTLRSDGWRIVFFSRKPDNLRHTTVEFLKIITGRHNMSSLVMRKKNEMRMDYREFLFREKETLRIEGFRVVALVSSQMDALRTTRFRGERVFKIPSPFFRDEIQDSTNY